MPTARRSAPRRASRRCCSTPGRKPRRRTEAMARRTHDPKTDAPTWPPAYRWMLVARRIDETMWTLRRQGKGHFVVSSAGHEAIGAAAALAADMRQDFLAPHYRDLTACLAWGLQPREVM